MRESLQTRPRSRRRARALRRRGPMSRIAVEEPSDRRFHGRTGCPGGALLAVALFAIACSDDGRRDDDRESSTTSAAGGSAPASLGLECGDASACTGFCTESGDSAEVCTSEGLSCLGTSEGMYCSTECQGDADCANANRTLLCAPASCSGSDAQQYVVCDGGWTSCSGSDADLYMALVANRCFTQSDWVLTMASFCE
jgi:hypothetical protein